MAHAPSPGSEQPPCLRLYIARSTPNSVRAQQNLAIVLETLHERPATLDIETIDVFAQPRRAMVDGVVVTPTLIAVAASRRVVLMGDLADRDHLRRMLQDFLTPGGASHTGRHSS